MSHHDRQHQKQKIGGAHNEQSGSTNIEELLKKISYSSGEPDEKLFSDTAEKWAKHIKEASTNTSNKHSQIRKFYDEVLYFRELVREDVEKFRKLKPYLNMLTAKAAYAEGRGHISTEFTEFIRKNLEQVKDPDTLSIFAGFFEAFMGFLKYYEEINKDKKKESKNN